MVFNAVFNSISVISRWPVHLSMFSWTSYNQYTIFLPSHWLLSHITIVETKDSRNESCRIDRYQSSERTLAGSGIEPATPVKSATLPTELLGSTNIRGLRRLNDVDFFSKHMSLSQSTAHLSLYVDACLSHFLSVANCK